MQMVLSAKANPCQQSLNEMRLLYGAHFVSSGKVLECFAETKGSQHEQ
ncbi:MAG: hypothetical protein ACJAZW_000956 [Maritalea sp.]|jgi:hypothetical protein